MSDLKITFTLSEKDVADLRRIMRRASAAAKDRDEESVIRSATKEFKSVREAKPPTFVLERVDKLQTIIELVQDKSWALPANIRRKIIGALAYFANPADLIPDSVPGLGFLDDAIMIELVVQELRHEIKAYQDFVRFRDTTEQRPWTRAAQASLETKLTTKRRALRARIEAAEAKEAERRQKGGGKGLFRLW